MYICFRTWHVCTGSEKKKVLRWLRPRWFCISRLPGDIFDATIEECKCEPISCDELDDNLSVVSNSVLSQLWCVVVGALRRTVFFLILSTLPVHKTKLEQLPSHVGLAFLHWRFCSTVLILVWCVTVSDARSYYLELLNEIKKGEESMALTRGGVEAQWTSLCNLFKGNGANGL